MQSNKIPLSMMNEKKIDFSKYLKLLWAKKFWVGSILILFTIIWSFTFDLFIKSTVEDYNVNTVIRFEDPWSREETSAVSDFASLGAAGKVALLTARSVLGRVVDTLHLNLVLRGNEIDPLDLFEKIEIDDSVKYGTYRITLKDNYLNTTYENLSENIPEHGLGRIKVEGSIPELNLNGIRILLKKNILQNDKEIVFDYVPKPFAINALRENIVTELDRSQTILKVTYKNRFPKLAAETVNILSQCFLNLLMDYKRRQTVNVLKSLEDQLQTAQKELSISEQELKSFRERNPYVTLSGEGGKIIQNLVETESTVTLSQKRLQDLNNLLKRKSDADNFDSINLYYQEVIHFLSQQNLIGTPITESQLASLTLERKTLLQEYSVKHPLVLENEKKILEAHARIDERSQQYLKQLSDEVLSGNRNINNFKRNLRSLPSQELRLAELQRNREVKEQIVSSVMVMYNEAKIADASIVPDAFIVDEAEPPMRVSNNLNFLFSYPLGLLLGLVLGIGVVVIIDLFDPSVKSVKLAEEVLKLPVLASIPVIGGEKKLPDPDELKKRIDPRLITVDYSPSIEGEAFRMIRTKLVFESLKDKNSLIVTSMSPDEGKSLVSCNLAITFAQQKYSTLLVDCDLRRGVLHNSFGCNKKPGLSDLLKSSSETDIDTIGSVIQETHIPNLFLLTSGTPIPNPSELLGSFKMKHFLEIVEKKFGVVLIDTPPIKFTPDAFVVNSLVHNILLVVRYGKTNLNKLAEKTKEFMGIKDDFVGVVLNASKEISKADRYSYSYYHY
jgi:succinoglycan biosynthesis transport protein ExoP